MHPSCDLESSAPWWKCTRVCLFILDSVPLKRLTQAEHGAIDVDQGTTQAKSFMPTSVYVGTKTNMQVQGELTFIDSYVMCQGLHSIVCCHCGGCRLFEAGFARQPWLPLNSLYRAGWP